MPKHTKPKVKLLTVYIRRKLNYAEHNAADEIRIRRQCAVNKITLPGDIEIEAEELLDDPKYQWAVTVWEDPNV